MKKPIFLTGLIALSLCIMPGCRKDTEDGTWSAVKTRNYIVDGKTYRLTFQTDEKGRNLVRDRTEDNLFIYDILRSNDQTVTYTDLSKNESLLFRNREDYAAYMAQLRKGSVAEPWQPAEKATTANVWARFYKHANYNTQIASNQMNKWAWQLTHPALLQCVQTFVGANWANSYVFHNDWVGSSVNDQISSFRVSTATPNVPLSWNHFALHIFSDNDYGGDLQIFVSKDTELPMQQPDLRNVIMWMVLFFSNNFNDEISSYYGVAFNYP